MNNHKAVYSIDEMVSKMRGQEENLLLLLGFHERFTIFQKISSKIARERQANTRTQNQFTFSTGERSGKYVFPLHCGSKFGLSGRRKMMSNTGEYDLPAAKTMSFINFFYVLAARFFNNLYFL